MNWQPRSAGLRRWSLGAGLAALSLCGCRSFAPPRPATLTNLAPLPLAAELQRDLHADGLSLVLELETPVLTGIFDLLAGVTEQGLRLQLFPDVGGKVLDMTVAPDWRSIRADVAGVAYHAAVPFDDAEPHLALLLAALFGELLTPVLPPRVIGERGDPGNPGDAGTAHQLLLQPVLPAAEVEVDLTAHGAISLYRIWIVVFAIELRGDGSFVGPRVRGRLCR